MARLLSLASHFPEHVIDHFAVLVLRAEQDDIGVLTHSDRVVRWPVEQVAAMDFFTAAVRIGHRERTLQDIAPVRSLAKIVLQPLKERGDIGACGE
ncbi:MAG: hypothetical protein J0I63_03145 [Thiobacillus sp.]|nr:hypothetical protein [Thiobacillus sp.]